MLILYKHKSFGVNIQTSCSNYQFSVIYSIIYWLKLFEYKCVNVTKRKFVNENDLRSTEKHKIIYTLHLVEAYRLKCIVLFKKSKNKMCFRILLHMVVTGNCVPSICNFFSQGLTKLYVQTNKIMKIKCLFYINISVWGKMYRHSIIIISCRLCAELLFFLIPGNN